METNRKKLFIRITQIQSVILSCLFVQDRPILNKNREETTKVTKPRRSGITDRVRFPLLPHEIHLIPPHPSGFKHWGVNAPVGVRSL